MNSSEHVRRPVARQLVGGGDEKRRRIGSHDVAQPSAEHPGVLVHDGSRVGTSTAWARQSGSSRSRPRPGWTAVRGLAKMDRRTRQPLL